MLPDDPFSLAGRVALIPGGYGDIGAAVARRFSAAGASVAIAGRDGARAEALADGLAGPALGLAMDVGDVKQIRDGVQRVAAHFGHLDILVNCVGIQREQRIDEVSEEAFDAVLNTNLRGAMFMAQAVARQQVAAVAAGRPPGQQVHVLSVRAHLGMRDRGYSAYCATKGALVMLVKQHAVELCKHGITVNGVAPTVVRGDMGAHWLADPAVRERLLQRIPLGRVAEPQDVTGPVQFFCSPAAAFVTGQILYVDGGLTATQ